MTKVAVVGTTSWGTTLAILLAQRHSQAWLLARGQEEADSLDSARENLIRLPGFPFPDTLQITSNLSQALDGAAMMVFAVPSRTLRDSIKQVRPYLEPATLLLNASKGLEARSGKRLSEVMAEELPRTYHRSICVLSGPNLSGEIARGEPASTVVASRRKDVAQAACELVSAPMFRVYINTDVIGVELGGALKNIIAIGAGIVDSLGYGDNTKAAFMTRGLAEMARLGVAAGGKAMTFAGLAGVGDLIATCASSSSRNHRLGQMLGQGRCLRDALGAFSSPPEGVDATSGALVLAARHQVEMPIAEQMAQVLFHDLDPRRAVANLLGRPLKMEWANLRMR